MPPFISVSPSETSWQQELPGHWCWVETEVPPKVCRDSFAKNEYPLFVQLAVVMQQGHGTASLRSAPSIAALWIPPSYDAEGGTGSVGPAAIDDILVAVRIADNHIAKRIPSK